MCGRVLGLGATETQESLFRNEKMAICHAESGSKEFVKNFGNGRGSRAAPARQAHRLIRGAYGHFVGGNPNMDEIFWKFSKKILEMLNL